MTLKKTLLAVSAGILLGASAQAAVFVQGTATTQIRVALNALGVSYTDLGTAGSMSNTPTSSDLLIMSYDGGTGTFIDYRSQLDQGMDIIMFGGSNYQPYRDWAAMYFNLTDTAGGWHLGGAWHKLSDNVATQYMPSDYMPQSASVGYHMLGFAATQNTTLLGENDEGVAIAAFREYANGGSFNYLAMDPGPYASMAGDQSNFLQPYLRGALEAAESGLSVGNQVPEPTGLLLLGVALGAAALTRRGGRIR